MSLLIPTLSRQPSRQSLSVLLKHLLPHATMDLVHAKGDHLVNCIVKNYDISYIEAVMNV
ncbi:hypothetical protein MTR_4g087940 [Medicago truncatula]|uniref:Uncharacterized protein n=1 Tax=Medicago truncatula TaxID=3880 RepID=G7JPQ4_MEDTR|nr:hypothetical protein MTR_4g087940 [Medicago truncatula]